MCFRVPGNTTAPEIDREHAEPGRRERLGLDPAHLRYTQPFGTANGQILAAPVTLKKLSLGPVTFDRVRAYVSDGDFTGSLLGLSLLRRFRSYEVRDGTLTLRW